MTPAYARLAETHGLEPIDGFRPGPVTPLLAKEGRWGRLSAATSSTASRA